MMRLSAFKIWAQRGLASSSAEMASKAGMGIEMNLDFVPQRETGMTAYEMMLSESQERMLIVVKKDGNKKLLICLRNMA